MTDQTDHPPMAAWQISERMPNHHRQRTSLENINDVLEVLGGGITPKQKLDALLGGRKATSFEAADFGAPMFKESEQ